jgi:hypothetical protein
VRTYCQRLASRQNVLLSIPRPWAFQRLWGLLCLLTSADFDGMFGGHVFPGDVETRR